MVAPRADYLWYDCGGHWAGVDGCCSWLPGAHAWCDSAWFCWWSFCGVDPGLLRWALILPLLDMPVKAFVVLYFHDVVGLNAAFANVTLIIIIAGTLVGRLLLSWVLQLMSGVLLLRLSVWFGLMSFALFLLVPFVTVKLVMLAVFSLVEADWYPLAKGQAYAAQPTRSGVVLSVPSLLSPITS